jgi:hypothetical protein
VHFDKGPHRVCSPDPSPSDFFLFGYLKDKLIDKKSETSEELFCEVAMITRAFLTRQERIETMS